ncbi:MucB/RseB C-terminal domain-containing protein [Undibacterium rugosum]|uniref:MucB/RseB C-terminal domain-containing protein n=1 Tax=Undibacterium rugosum TaxID=2762291 RepID=A0A923KZ40_9BURK|nr:MucB/RseB C-terminal domain-containing protein [Undibacterium rugosum]MBC3935388.1 MucB/RseB C-terminal domain-containing protein [Undibacterium rugosum]MBR7778837.1 MucB/RseB C-terminal domain-containing protein [Undibacterium rugosum]
MSGRRLYTAANLALLCTLSSSVFATENAEDKREIQHVLRKIQASAQKMNYSGTFVYQQASQIRTSRITHHLDAGGETEKLEILDGKPREYIRRNDEVSCYLPDSKTIQVEKDVSQESFPALLTQNAQYLPDFYTIRKGEMSRVAGLECQTYSLEPKDGFRYGYRLCAEKSSGLMLRAQTVNPKNEVIEQIAFTQLQVNDIDKNKLKPSFPNVNQWRIENLTVQSNIQSGWVVKALPAGFTKTKELKRVIPSPANANNASASGNAGSASANAAANKTAKSHQVIQMMFSDGLAAMSVFIEPYSEGRTEGSLQQGAMTIMGKRQGEYWLTVVGEVPVSAIRQVMNSIELKANK